MTNKIEKVEESKKIYTFEAETVGEIKTSMPKV